ncbi:MAG: acyl-CoA thioesterase [Acidimicrobiia bacterium]
MRVSFAPPLDPAAYRFAHQLRVRFAETDAMAVAHHSSYLLYLEVARVEYLRAIGHAYDQVRAEGLDFPVIEVHVSYLRPVRFDDPVEVHVVVATSGPATFQMGYLITVDGQARATAVTVHAVVDAGGRPGRTPDWVRKLVDPPAPAG